MMTKTTEKIDSTFDEWLGEKNGEMPHFQLVQGLDELYGEGPEQAETEEVQQALRVEMDKTLPPIVCYDQFNDLNLGQVWLALRGEDVVAVSYQETEAAFLVYLGKLIEGRFVRSGEDVNWAKQDIVEYLLGKRESFGLHTDLSTITEFQRRVLEEASKIPRGQVATYGEIAKRIGKPKASRAVGQALRRNPIPIVVPCHRVVASDGTLGGYSGRMGDERKAHLLKLEGVVFA